MLFPTLTFHIFFLFVFGVNWALRRSVDWRLIFLLVASWVFYGVWDWRFVALLQASAFVNWGCANLIVNAQDNLKLKKFWVIIGVVLNLVILAAFKYFDFFAEEINAVLHSIGWQRDIPIIGIILPVGVSFSSSES